MTDYTSKTDNEIDRMVSAITGSNEGLDYCSDWAAIGEIMDEHDINIEDHVGDFRAYTGSFQGVAPTRRRAVAICFLMMQAEG